MLVMVPTSKHIIDKAVLIAIGICIVIGLVCCIGYCSELQQIQYQEPVQEFHDTPATQDDIGYWENYKKQQEKQQVVTLQKAIMKSETTFPNLNSYNGVNYFGGVKQTYYSSNRAPHMNIDQWHTDRRGFWRDSEGYIVIAYTMTLPYGSIIPLGENCWGKVLDHCPTEGVVDVYVQW